MTIDSSKIAKMLQKSLFLGNNNENAMSESSERRAVILSALLKETLHRCIVCGSPIGEGEPCSIATIYPPSPSGETDPKVKSVLCEKCMEKKGPVPVPLLAASLDFQERKGYLLRVMDAWIHGRITSRKRNLLLKGFSLLRRGRPVEEIPRSKMDRLLEETDHKCIYCGCQLKKMTYTVDHIIPRTMGGPSNYANSVASCKECNGAKSNVPLDFYLGTMSPERYRDYRARVLRLERRKKLSPGKAKTLLGGNGVLRSVRFTLFGSEYTVSIHRRKL